ncbi:ABC-type antimicrobial peptide transport system permease subunit [Chitinophaga polysaccharea]|uniref:ABC-type antimicrobial peptide transport system permease subunit n=2 Tax=Chitinophaga polysaccharea TaxID=1293035 RepID=A0A561P2M5_9BACT|nr:ABC-type antimicrobial peptide transport system permease subunit [Chitinophaga polysaccharea]
MQLHWFKTAWRNIHSNRFFAFINLIGLTAGFAGAMLIFCLVYYHLSFDNFHLDGDRIYRMVSASHYEEDDYSQGVPQPVGKAFRNDYIYGEYIAMRSSLGEPQVTVGSGAAKKIFNSEAAYVEADYFRIFNYPFIRGNAAVLTAPDQAVITEKEAKRFFPGRDPVGQQIVINNGNAYTIAGVLKDIPSNTSNRQQLYLSYANYRKANPWMGGDSSWAAVSSGVQCFVKLRPGISAAAVEKVFPAFLSKYISPEGAKHASLFLQPLSDIHFNRTYDGQTEKKQLWVLATVGLFLVLMAGINFVNLATARLFYRSREAGVRKVLGSSPSQIRWQFITETAILVFTSTILSLLTAYAALPSFNQLFDTTISSAALYQPVFIGFSLALFVTVSLLVGYYPGTLLSRLKPAETIRGKLGVARTAGVPLRKVLVVSQFAIVLFMISCTLIISRQMKASMDTDIGFNKTGIVMVDVPNQDLSVIETIRQRVGMLAGVNGLSFCYSSPMSNMYNLNDFEFENATAKTGFRINEKAADTSYLHTFGLHLVAGRNMTGGDTAATCLVNETFVKRMKYTPEQILGRKMTAFGRKVVITGVVKDFHTNDFHEEIAPVCLVSNYRSYGRCAVAMDMRKAKQLLPAMEKVWKEVFPDYGWSYNFLDDNIRDMYHAEETLLKLIQIFSSLVILVGCIGLFGMVSFIAVQRKKEIGVRKVLGASVTSILWLFMKEFLQLLLMALLVAIPVAWYVMHQWLQDFAFRVTLKPGYFVMPVLITTVLVLLTISVKSVRAALSNPVHSLKNE